MKMNKFKRIVATAMMTIMALGSSMTAFAAGDTTATGTDKSTNHLDTDYVDWTLPTAGSVGETFNFWVDPEDILAKADKLPDGTDAKDYHNDNLVYFKVSENGAVSYNSTSNSVSMNIKNYVSANVIVKATLKNADATRIPFAKDDAEIEANTTAEKASLLLKLNVGTSSNAIVDSGSTAEYEVAGQPDNFGVSLNSAANAEVISYKLTPSENATWSSVSINLSGKASQGEVTDSLIAPQVELTWDIKSTAGGNYEEKSAYGKWSGTTLWMGVDSSTGFSGSSVKVEASIDGTTYTTVAAEKYSYSSSWVSIAWSSITDAVGDANPATAYVRVTDGKTRYTYKAK
jgi:hypothetical protein